MGRSRPTSAVVPALVGPADSIMALLNLHRGLGDRLAGGLDQLVSGSDVLGDPLAKRPLGPVDPSSRSRSITASQ
jgi:hypothetical protein